MDYKQVILVRKDLNLSKGKMAAQVAHASVEAVLRADKKKLSAWHSEGMKKVVLKVDSLKDLHKYCQIAKDDGLTTAIITDGGLTEIPAGTVTCAAIGPDAEDVIDRITGSLKIM